MAHSIITRLGDGITSQFSLGFTLGQLSRDDVKCRVGDEVDGLGDPVYRTLTWITDGLVTVDGDVPGDEVPVVFTRTVRKDQLQHNYSNGAAIEESNLDESNLQALMAIHEFLDGRIEQLANDLDMGGFRIVNMGAGEDDDDAATIEQLNIVLNAAPNIETVAESIDNVNIVADDIDNVNTVAGVIGNVNTVAGISANVTTVAGIHANVTTVAGIAANVTTVAGIAAAVSNVSSISAAVSNASSISAAISNVSSISAAVSTVSGNSANVSTVAGISANVSTVAGVSAAVSTVATNIASVNTVAGNQANINTVAGISGNVTTVAGANAAISTVNTNIANVNTVATNIANVNTVAGISANVTTVAGVSADVTTVATNISSVNTVATNMSAILAALAGVREKLTADRTYYVRTGGSDSNTGLTDTNGGAFLTIQKAVDVVRDTLDLCGKVVTIQVRSGTYTAGASLTGRLTGQTGDVSLLFVGDAATPTNVVISTTSADCFTATRGAQFSVSGFKLQTTTSGDGIVVTTQGTRVRVNGAMNYGAIAGVCFNLNGGGEIQNNSADYTISGSHGQHINIGSYGRYTGSSRTVTLTGTPAWTTSFCVASNGYCNLSGVTWSGSATGSRYQLAQNAILFTNGQATTWIPGSVAGTTATQAQYL